MARSGEVDSTVEKPRPFNCLIRSVRDRANKWLRRLCPCRSGDSPRLLNVISGTLSAPARRKRMPYRIAGIDVHKKTLAVVVADVEVHEEY